MKILEIKNLKKSFPQSKKETLTVLEDISLEINQGDIYGIIGLSGEGKSTLVRCINRLENSDSGDIFYYDEAGKEININTLKGKELRDYRREVAMIFQDFNLLDQTSVFNNVKFPLTLDKNLRETIVEEYCIEHEISSQIKEKDIISLRVEELLSLVGLEEKADSYPSTLSGGQRQRVAIARALVSNPRILLCDECTSALDPETAFQILELLKELNKKLGITIIIISHQMSVIEKICNKVAILSGKTIAEKGTIREVFLKPQTEIGKRLIYSERLNTELSEGKGIRLQFDGNANEPIVTLLIETCNVLVNILFADTRVDNGKVYGQLIFQLPYHDEDIEKVESFLDAHHIDFEVIDL